MYRYVDALAFLHVPMKPASLGRGLCVFLVKSGTFVLRSYDLHTVSDNSPARLGLACEQTNN